ncbi:hypothetical protein [uncultured Demequina sp.]|uniref:hypothetical protein n=1 Tax=uncultured Demequina sp. TaxID=693499 RepID=UPI0025E9D1FF|nr:hypothetical protein [uncultured Demequina sp.]
MARWRDSYGTIVREHYADLLAWTLLLVDDEDRARALVDSALAAELSRAHAPEDPRELLVALRARIVRACLAAPEPEAGPRGAGPRRADPYGAGPAEAGPTEHGSTAEPEPDVDLSVYAPPPAASAPPRAGDDPAVAPAASAALPSPRPARVSVRAALADLSPRVRAVVVLHHHDQLAVADVARFAGMTPVEATGLLRAGGAELQRRTGVAVPAIADAGADGGSAVSVAIEEWA